MCHNMGSSETMDNTSNVRWLWELHSSILHSDDWRGPRLCDGPPGAEKGERVSPEHFSWSRISRVPWSCAMILQSAKSGDIFLLIRVVQPSGLVQTVGRSTALDVRGLTIRGIFDPAKNPKSSYDHVNAPKTAWNFAWEKICDGLEVR